MCLACQTKIQLCMEGTFSGWADIVVRRTLIVFLISFAVFIALALGMGQAQEFEDESIIWTPLGNQSLKDRDKSEILFPVEEKFNFVSVIWEAKGDNILTIESLLEMKSFEESVLRSAFEYSDTKLDALNQLERKKEGYLFKYDDVCQLTTFSRDQIGEDGNVVLNDDGEPVQEVVEKCTNSPNLLDFVWSFDTQTYETNPGQQFSTQEALLAQIRKGRGDDDRYGEDEYLNLYRMVSETVPSDFSQKRFDGDPQYTGLATDRIGTNNIEKAKAIQYTYVMEHNRNPDIHEEAYLGFEEKVHELFDNWVKNVRTADVQLQTINGFLEAIVEDINNDFGLIFGAILLVVIYLFLFLGTFSPMHCRCVVALVGLICVLLSYLSGFGLMYLCGGETTGVHQLMPFLLIGIGADDMFVMCNAVDQTKYKDSARDRIVEALGHAGPAITITSLTNALAFAFGATGSLQALRSFCLFASICIVMLYLTVLTVFLSVLVWDTKRVQSKTQECCGLCCCEEKTIICCNGFCLSIKQMEYNELPIPQKTLDRLKEDEQNSSPAVQTVLKASGTEKCLGKYIAPCILHKWGRLVWLVVYLAWSAVAIIGITKVEIHFEIDFFVSKDSDIYNYLQAQDKYFDTGSIATNVFIESETVDFSATDVQADVEALQVALEECDGCKEDWHIEDSLETWTRPHFDFVKRGECYSKPEGLLPEDTVIPKEVFYPCLTQFLRENPYYFGDIQFKDNGAIKGWRQSIMPKKIDAVASDGPQYLDDIRAICDKHGVGETYAYSEQMLDYEQYVVFLKETLFSVGLSICAVFLVVLFITGSFPVTILVVFAVALVDVYLMALIYFWDLTLNNIIVVQLVIGLGLSVDYSAHISHTYLIVVAPSEMSTMEKRMYKARVAISRMGSSVIHGGISTFLAIIVLSGAKSYIFVVFFKVWLGIIVFGMSNGFILLPIIFSLIGPTPDPMHKEKEKERRFSRSASLKGDVAKLQAQMGIAQGTPVDNEEPSVSKPVVTNESQVHPKPSEKEPEKEAKQEAAEGGEVEMITSMNFIKGDAV